MPTRSADQRPTASPGRYRMVAGQDQGASFLSDIVQSQTTGGPQTRQLCARKAGLNDTHSFVDLWIGPTTRRYSSLAAPNTQVRIQVPARPVGNASAS